MSDSLSLAEVTSAIQNLLAPRLTAALPGTVVSALRPDRARTATTQNLLNVFLYSIVPGISPQQRPGAPSSLAIKLFYLITAYGADDGPVDQSQQTLTEAMRALHENPILMIPGIASTRLTVNLYALTVAESAQLWTMLQCPYRLSVAYEVSGVQINP